MCKKLIFFSKSRVDILVYILLKSMDFNTENHTSQFYSMLI